MSLPTTSVTTTDGGLGLQASAAAELPHVKIGACSSGTENELVSLSDAAAVPAALGRGPLARACAHCLGSITNGRAPGPVYALRVHASVAGICGATTKTAVDASTGTVAGSGAANDTYGVRVEITRDGTVGVGAFIYSLDDGDTYSEEIAIPGGGTYAVPDTGITLTFTAGGGPAYFETGDVHAFRTRAPGYTTDDLADAVTALLADSRDWEGVHLVGPPAPASTAVTEAGTAPPDVTVSGTPTGYFDVVVEITTGGARGTAVFRVSLDGGLTWLAEGVTTAATYVVLGTGLTLAFATGTNYSTDNVYTFNTCNFSGLATLYGAAKTHMDTAEAAARYAWCVVEAPTVGSTTDTELIAGLASAVRSGRMCVAAGFAEVSSPLDAKLETRPQAWSLVARVAALPISQSPGERSDSLGPLARTTRLYRDERQTEALYAAKIATLQTDLGAAGFFVSGDGALFSPAGSDFDAFPNRRVLDAACRTARLAARQYQSARVPVNKDTGFILETAARSIETAIAAKVRATLAGHASDVQVRVVRTDNLLLTKTLRADVRVVPFGYATSVGLTIGLVNPAALVAAA